MKAYRHLGNYVILITLEYDFLYYLKGEKVSYRVLPVLLDYPFKQGDYIVKYTSAEEAYTYALVTVYGDQRTVFITECVPEDGWEALMMDILDQEHYGYPEKEPHSLTYVVLEQILCDICMDRYLPPISPFNFDPYISKLTDSDKNKIVDGLAEYGIKEDTINAIGAWDIKIKLLNWLGFPVGETNDMMQVR